MMLNKGVQLPCQLQHQQLLPWPHWLCLLYQVRKPDVSFTCFLSTLLFRQVYQLCFSDRFTNFDITLFKGTDYHFFKFNHRLLPKMRLMYIWENTLPYFSARQNEYFLSKLPKIGIHLSAHKSLIFEKKNGSVKCSHILYAYKPIFKDKSLWWFLIKYNDQSLEGFYSLVSILHTNIHITYYICNNMKLLSFLFS